MWLMLVNLMDGTTRFLGFDSPAACQTALEWVERSAEVVAAACVAAV